MSIGSGCHVAVQHVDFVVQHTVGWIWIPRPEKIIRRFRNSGEVPKVHVDVLETWSQKSKVRMKHIKT